MCRRGEMRFPHECFCALKQVGLERASVPVKRNGGMRRAWLSQMLAIAEGATPVLAVGAVGITAAVGVMIFAIRQSLGAMGLRSTACDLLLASSSDIVFWVTVPQLVVGPCALLAVWDICRSDRFDVWAIRMRPLEKWMKMLYLFGVVAICFSAFYVLVAGVQCFAMPEIGQKGTLMLRQLGASPFDGMDAVTGHVLLLVAALLLAFADSFLAICGEGTVFVFFLAATGRPTLSFVATLATVFAVGRFLDSVRLLGLGACFFLNPHPVALLSAVAGACVAVFVVPSLYRKGVSC